MYVYNGFDPSVKAETREKRRMDLAKAGRDWSNLLERVASNDSCTFTDAEVELATQARIKIKIQQRLIMQTY